MKDSHIDVFGRTKPLFNDEENISWKGVCTTTDLERRRAELDESDAKVLKLKSSLKPKHKKLNKILGTAGLTIGLLSMATFIGLEAYRPQIKNEEQQYKLGQFDTFLFIETLVSCSLGTYALLPKDDDEKKQENTDEEEKQ